MVIGARPTHELNPERRPLFEMLVAAASQVWEADLLRVIDLPDAFLHEEPRYVTWTPQIHRAPAS